MLIVVSMESLLFSSADEALSTVGEPTRQIFLRHLEQERIDFSPNKVDLKALEIELGEFFGAGSPVIIDMIYELFMGKAIEAGIVGPDSYPRIDGPEQDRN